MVTWQHDAVVTTAELLERGRAALRVGDWEVARSAFEASLAAEPSAAAEEGLAMALFWLNRSAESRDHAERAYRLAREEQDVELAARAAVLLSKYYFLHTGDEAVANGWLSRAERLLQGTQSGPARARLLIMRGQAQRDPAAMVAMLDEAAAIAHRFRDTDAEVLALAYRGLGLCTGGELSKGMQQLDEAMAAATGGEVTDLQVVGEIYCAMLTACERTVDFDRADQWCRVANGYVDRHRQTPMSGSCRACYGSVLTATGRWKEAEHQLLEALRNFEGGYRAMRADALVRLANLRIRQGRIDEAQRLLEGWEDHPDAQLPLAALQAARAMDQLAANTLRRRLDQLGRDSVMRAPLLSLLVQIQLNQADISGARASAISIANLAGEGAADSIRGLAFLAKARVQLAGGEEALLDLESALQFLLRAEMPFETAECRLLLAEALGEQSEAVARSHARQALDAFSQLGAVEARDRAAHVLQKLGGAARTGPKAYGPLSRREEDVLRLLSMGLSNDQIAAKLFISRRTAEHHVSNILSKLGLASRAEAAAYAARRPAEN